MSEKKLSIPVDEQVGFFLPILENHIQNLTSAISSASNQDYSEAEWLIVLSPQKAGKFVNHHFLTELWDDISDFLRKKIKLYFFIDAKTIGLVEKSYKFWLFFSPATASDHFSRLAEKPQDFSPHNIKPVPNPDLVQPLIEATDTALSINLSSNIKMLAKIGEIISIADYYLEGEDLEAFDTYTKKATAEMLSNEVNQLKIDIDNPAMTPSIIQKRLRYSLKIGWRYFRAKNELETNYFRKFLSEENSERKKGLNLASKKISDFISGGS